MRGFLFGLAISMLILFSAVSGALADRLFVFKPLNSFIPEKFQRSGNGQAGIYQQGSNLSENTESTIVSVANLARGSVVTVSIKQNVAQPNQLQFSPMGGFQILPGESKSVQQDIGTGFVVDTERGFVVTNKHVVSTVDAEYKLVDDSGKEYAVEKIYRDPSNDLAILKTSARLPALTMSNSEDIKIGQTVIAIGTALGEFRQTVTTGIVSGLGRGIDASDGFSSERIDNLIQTDAAINPGNSGGPLLNSKGEVIGVNVAMARAENIGFAIPINVVKESLDNFDKTGEFNRPLLGVQYKFIPQETALLNDVPQGAYITLVLENSTAAEMGVKPGDIITAIDDKKLTDEKGGLASLINQKKVGEEIKLEVWRDGAISQLSGILKTSG